MKALCVKMYLNGIGFRTIERVTDISHNRVIHWVREFEAAQIDELQTLIGSKKQMLAVDGRQHESGEHLEVCRRRPFSRDV